MGGEEKAVICTVSSECKLYAWNVYTANLAKSCTVNACLCLSCCGGDIYTLTGPELRNVSEVNAFQRSVGWLHSPPGKKWISESETHEHILPKTGATLMTKTEFATFDPTTERTWGWIVIRACLPMCACILYAFSKTAPLVAHFLLSVHMETPAGMGISDGNRIISETGACLLPFTIHGLLLQRFEHKKVIGKSLL
ncbi:hypothetical protein R6Z07M_016335 [Ovis aries]